MRLYVAVAAVGGVSSAVLRGSWAGSSRSRTIIADAVIIENRRLSADSRSHRLCQTAPPRPPRPAASNESAESAASQWTRRIRLRHLEVLLTIARHGSLTAAAAALDITQPAMSQWLADIEAAAGARLFERGSAPAPHALSRRRCWRMPSASCRTRAARWPNCRPSARAVRAGCASARCRWPRPRWCPRRCCGCASVRRASSCSWCRTSPPRCGHSSSATNSTCW